MTMKAPAVGSDRHDVLILLNTAPHKRLWIASLFMRNCGPAIRTLGRLPYANRYSLLSVALVSALRSIKPTHLEKIKSRNSKLRVKVVVNDSSFAIGLKALQDKEQNDDLRAARNILSDLSALLARYDIDINVERDNKALLSLFNWASKSVYSPLGVGDLPAIFQPSIASQFA
jgi:hypothetical protein